MNFRQTKKKYSTDVLMYYVNNLYKIMYPVFKDNRKFTEDELLDIHFWASCVNKIKKDIHKLKFYRSYLKKLNKNKIYKFEIPVECITDRELLKDYLIKENKIEDAYIDIWLYM
jgi:hypothetical protein